MAGDGAGYPFSQEQKLFEQNGYLKAEIERLRKDMVTQVHLLETEKRLESFITARDKARTDELMGQLDRAFKNGIPGTRQLVAEEIDNVKKREREDLEAKLKRRGLKLNESEEIVPITHPAVRLVKQNLLVLAGMIFVTALLKPEYLYSAARFVWSIIE